MTKLRLLPENLPINPTSSFHCHSKSLVTERRALASLFSSYFYWTKSKYCRASKSKYGNEHEVTCLKLKHLDFSHELLKDKNCFRSFMIDLYYSFTEFRVNDPSMRTHPLDSPSTSHPLEETLSFEERMFDANSYIVWKVPTFIMGILFLVPLFTKLAQAGCNQL